MFIYLADHNKLNDAEYTALIGFIFELKSPQVLALYPPKPFIGDKRPAISVLGTDYVFTAPNRNIASSLSKYNKVYLYQFDHVMSFGNAAWGPNFTFCDGHVCHGSELPFLFVRSRTRIDTDLWVVCLFENEVSVEEFFRILPVSLAIYWCFSVVHFLPRP